MPSTPERVIGRALRRQRLVELRQVFLVPGHIAGQPVPPFVRTDGSGEDLEHGGVHALALRAADALQSAPDLVGDPADRQLLGHDIMLARMCRHEGTGPDPSWALRPPARGGPSLAG